MEYELIDDTEVLLDTPAHFLYVPILTEAAK